MDDLISRQAAIDATAYSTISVTISGKRGFQNYKEEFEKACVAIRDKYIEALKDLPSAQPEIIRCKDCKYHDANECKHSHALIVSKDDDFCSYAERRIDE